MVDASALALQKLSDGDTTHRIGTAFAGALDRVRQDFNSVAEKLQRAPVSVGENAELPNARPSSSSPS